VLHLSCPGLEGVPVVPVVPVVQDVEDVEDTEDVEDHGGREEHGKIPEKHFGASSEDTSRSSMRLGWLTTGGV